VLTPDAIRLLEYALHLRMYGENAPGGTETWAEWDRMTEGFLRDHHCAERGHASDGRCCPSWFKEAVNG
jgi:hypothetical protein